MIICRTEYPTRSLAFMCSIPRSGSIQNGLRRFGSASAALSDLHDPPHVYFVVNSGLQYVRRLDNPLAPSGWDKDTQ